MSIDTRPESLVDPEPEQARDLSPLDGLRWVYQFLHSKKLGLVLILALGLFTLLGTILTQAPSGARTSPEAWASWVEQVRPKYGGWTDILAAAGLFTVFSSWWFVATTVLLSVSIVACTTHRLPRLWAAATRPHVHVRDAFFEHARLRTTVPLSLDADAAAARVRDRLGRQRFRVLADDAPGSLYADRFRWAPFGTAIAHLAFIVILVGVLVSSLGGFRDEDFSVTTGYTREVGHDTGLALTLTSFTDDYYPDGRPKDYASDVVLSRGGQEVARHTIRVNDPLRYDGVTFYQASFGTAAELLITDAAGKELFRDGVPLDRTTDDRQNVFGRLLLSTDAEVYVIGAASGAQASEIAAGEMLLEFYAPDSTTPMGRQLLSQGRPATVGDLTFTFVREQKYSSLIAARDPGVWWIWVGSALLVIGTTMTMFFRHRRLWVRVAPTASGSEVHLACPDRTDSVFTRQFHALADSLKEPDHA